VHPQPASRGLVDDVRAMPAAVVATAAPSGVKRRGQDEQPRGRVEVARLVSRQRRVVRRDDLCSVRDRQR
jgi:hypothetical protein